MRSLAKAWPIGLLFWLVAAAAGNSMPTLFAHALHPIQPVETWHRMRADRLLDETATRDARFVDQLVACLPHRAPPDAFDIAAETQFRFMDADWRGRVLDIRRVMLGLETERGEQVRRNRQLDSWLMHIFPAAAAYAASAEVVGTGPSTISAWEDAVRQHHVRLSAALFDDPPLVNLQVPYGTGAMEMAFRRRPAPSYDRLPRFDHPATLGVVRGSVPYLVSLLIWWVVTTAAAIESRVRLGRQA